MSSQKNQNKPRLGRGLASLIGNSIAKPTGNSSARLDESAGGARPAEVAISNIAPNPYQPRRTFRQQELDELAESIARQGILQPIIISSGVGHGVDQPYIVIAGERRLRAAKKAGLQKVPCIIKEASAQQLAEWALIENIQRADLNPIERASGFRELVDRFGLTQAQIGERLGQPRATVANYLRILDLCDEIRKLIVDGDLSFGHAKIIAGLASQPRQLSLARKVAATGMSVRQLEQFVAQEGTISSEGVGAKKRKGREANIVDLEEQLSRLMGTKVRIAPRNKKSGKIIVEYYSLDDFDRFCKNMGLKIDS